MNLSQLSLPIDLGATLLQDTRRELCVHTALVSESHRRAGAVFFDSVAQQDVEVVCVVTWFARESLEYTLREVGSQRVIWGLNSTTDSDALRCSGRMGYSAMRRKTSAVVRWVSVLVDFYSLDA